MADAILRTEDVVIKFGGLTAVSGFSIEAERGSISSLIGPNGAGKTTCFNIITGFYKPTSGRVIFNGKDVTGMPPHLVCKTGIARTFQNIRLFTGGTVLQNVMTACWVASARRGGARRSSFRSSAVRSARYASALWSCSPPSASTGSPRR